MPPSLDLPPSPFMRIFCGCHPVVAAGTPELPSTKVCDNLSNSNPNDSIFNTIELRSESGNTAKSFLDVIHKQPPKIVSIKNKKDDNLFEEITPLQSAILAAISHAAKNSETLSSCNDNANIKHAILSPEHLETKLNNVLKENGFVRLSDVLALFEAVKRRGFCDNQMAMVIIRSFGSRMSLDRAAQKLNLLEEVWLTLPKLGVCYNVEHYNAALRVLIENEESFSPIQVLLEMESQGKKFTDGSKTNLQEVKPDRNTYELFIALFCQEGRVDGVGPVLNHMQTKNLLVGENILNSLIYGHLKVGDEITASKIIGLMAQTGISTTVSTVEAILCGYAEKGDILKMSMVIKEARKKRVSDNQVDLRCIIKGENNQSTQSSIFSPTEDVIIPSSPTALTPTTVATFSFDDVKLLPLIDNQALLSAILALVKCGHGEHLKILLNQIRLTSKTPIFFLHQFKNALFHLLIEGYKKEAFAMLGYFMTKAFTVADSNSFESESSDFSTTCDNLVRTFFEAVLSLKLPLEEFLILFSRHLFESNPVVATKLLQNNIDIISQNYSESELVFLS